MTLAELQLLLAAVPPFAKDRPSFVIVSPTSDPTPFMFCHPGGEAEDEAYRTEEELIAAIKAAC